MGGYNQMEEKKKKGIIVAVILIAIIIFLATIVLIQKFAPSKEVKDLAEYYNIKEDEYLVVVQNEVSEKHALYIDGEIYVDYNTVEEDFNHRFYWDSNENLLIYTTATEIIKTEVGSKEYYVNKSKTETDYQIVKTQGEDVYIALDYINMFSNIEYELYQNPNRLVVDCKWGKTYTYSDVKKATQIRVEASIKSPILKKVEADDRVVWLEEAATENGFVKVMSRDGVVGYIKNKCLTKAYQEELKSQKQEEEYSHISKDYKVNLTWNQVTNEDANASLLSLLSNTKGLTTISPTWFSVSNNEGELSSLASEVYVETAHNFGLEVWALVDDFNKDVDMYKVLSNTSNREKLSNELIADAIKYNLDGINVDFENITEICGKHYIQFLRELSVKCRNNGIILSVDSYVPSTYTEYYDREEQGKIVDYVVVMAYDEHYSGSEISGSVSSIGFVSDAVSNILEQVAPERVIIAMPFYTRVWKEVTENNTTKVSSEAYGMDSAMSLFTGNGVTPEWDESTGQYYGEFKSDGALYRCWFEDERSIEMKLKTITEGKAAGVASWKLGLEKQEIWNVILKYVN